MAAEGLVQVAMTKSVDFASKNELIWVEPEHAAALVEMRLARVVRTAEVKADGDRGEGDGEQAAGDSAGGAGKRSRGEKGR